MEDSELEPLPRELRKHLENGSKVGPSATPSPWKHPWILHHHILEVRRRHPNAAFGNEHRLHDFLVVLPIGKDA